MTDRTNQSYLVAAISAARLENNTRWMRLLQIALDCDPERTKAELRHINANDQKISELLTELAK